MRLRGHSCGPVPAVRTVETVSATSYWKDIPAQIIRQAGLINLVVQGNAAVTAAQMKQQIHQLAAAAAAAASAYPAALAAQLAAASSGAFPQDFAASALAGPGGLLPYSTSQGMALPAQGSACRAQSSIAWYSCFLCLTSKSMQQEDPSLNIDRCS